MHGRLFTSIFKVMRNHRRAECFNKGKNSLDRGQKTIYCLDAYILNDCKKTNNDWNDWWMEQWFAMIKTEKRVIRRHKGCTFMLQKDRYEISKHVKCSGSRRGAKTPSEHWQNTFEQGTAPQNAHKGTCNELATHSRMCRPYAGGTDSSTLLMIPNGMNGQEEESQICTIECCRTWKTLAGFLKMPLWCHLFQTIRSIVTKTSRQLLNICALFLIHQWLRKAQEVNVLGLVSVTCRRLRSCHKIGDKCWCVMHSYKVHLIDWLPTSLVFT